MAETVNFSEGTIATSAGATGLEAHAPGNPATVSALANASGGINAGNVVEVDIDEELSRFKSDDTPLMNLMLKAKKVKVESPEVQHFMIDEPRSFVTTTAEIKAGSTPSNTFPLSLSPEEAAIPRPYGTLLVKGVTGFAEDGKTTTPGKEMMLFVVGHNENGLPICRAINGPKTNPTDEYCVVPTIPIGTTCVILSNALYETQKEVDPDLIVPQAETIYLQKRGMNQVVSDYFDAQKKRIPFSKAILAEQAITNFKVRGNRTLWAGRKSKFKVNVPKMGIQSVYTTEGVRWQFKKELQHTGKWTIERLIALAKMFFTGEDVPKTSILLAGKNFLENIQTIDYSEHPEIQITTTTNPVGWKVTNIHTVFGDIELKHEPTLDRLGWSNSGALLAYDRLVHYQYTSEHSFSDRVEGEEATRTGIIVWDALALKGSCHIWIDGEGETGGSGVVFEMWEETTAPSKDGVYYFLTDCENGAKTGEIWERANSSWKMFNGDVYAN